MTDDDTAARPRRTRVAMLVAAVLAVAGAVLLVVALTGRQSPPVAPAPTAAGALPGPSVVVNGPADLPVPRGEVLPASPPASISIPSIGVESVVGEVGLAPDGSLEVPQPGPTYDDAAWYRDSAVPGTIGPSVVIGHVDSAENGPSVFFDLGRMQTGQEIEVKREDGTTGIFRVDDVQSFPKDQFPTRSVYGNTDRAELRLITCSGPFNSAAASYEDNTVVFAHLVGSVRS